MVCDTGLGSVARMETVLAPTRTTLVVRVWLPDRPGALAQVAGRIGAVRGDVVGIEILERGGGSAIDELTVSLPDDTLVELLVSEIRQVEGVAVEDVRPVAADRPEGAMAALAAVEHIVAAPPAERIGATCVALRTLVDGDWSVVLASGAVVGSCGTPPDLEWLSAFIEGSAHLANADTTAHTPGDLVWTSLPTRGMVLACGRAERVFHARERNEVHAIGRVLDHLG